MTSTTTTPLAALIATLHEQGYRAELFPADPATQKG